MNDTSPQGMTVAKADPSGVGPRLLDLFLAFSGMAVMGFGGVLPWARRMLVEQRRWLTGEEFTEVLSLGQFLPGGNIINVAVVVGARLRGPLGSVAAVAGLMAAPCVAVILAGALYARFADVPQVKGALMGITAAAVGLLIAMTLKMLQPFVAKRAPGPLVFVLLTFAAVGVFRISLPLTLVVLVPLSIAFAWRRSA
jgi:chromate transporter